MLSGEATTTSYIVFGMTQSGLEPTIYHTQGGCDNHYTTDALPSKTKQIHNALIMFVIDNAICTTFYRYLILLFQ